MMLIRIANLWCLGSEGIVYHQVMEAVDVGVDDSDLTALEECVSDSQGSKGILLWAESERRLCASLCGGTGGTKGYVF